MLYDNLGNEISYVVLRLYALTGYHTRHTNLMLERFTFLKNVCKDSSVKFPSLNTECYGWIVKERIIMEY